MQLSLLGIGPVTAMGAGMQTLSDALRGKKEPLIQHHHVNLRSGPLTIPAYMAEIQGLDRFVPTSGLRRMDRFSQMALLASCLAMEDAHIQLAEYARVGTVFGLGYGSLQSIFEFEDSVLQHGDANPSPTIFSRSVTNAIACSVATRLKLEGPSITLTSFEETVAGGFFIAANLLESAMADYILLGLGDEFHPARALATALMAGSDYTELKPEAWDECTYIPGEGFVAFVLARADIAPKYGFVSSYLRDTASAQDLISGRRAVIVDACGDKTRSRAYKRLKFTQSPISYAQLYGAMPTGAAIDLALAAAACKDRPWVPGLEAATDGIFCISSQGQSRFHLLRIQPA